MTAKIIKTHRDYVARSEYNAALPPALKRLGCTWDGNQWRGQNGAAMTQVLRGIYGAVVEIDLSGVMSAADLEVVVNEYGAATPEFMPNDPSRGEWIAARITPLLSTDQLQAIQNTGADCYGQSISGLLADRRRAAKAREMQAQRRS